MKNKLFQLMLALLMTFASADAQAKSRKDVDRLGREVIEAENKVTGLEKDRDNFDRQYPDAKLHTPEQKKKLESILAAIDQAVKAAADKHKEWTDADLALLAAGDPGNGKRRPAAGQAYEHENGSCPFVSDTISRAAGVMEGGLHWSANGKVMLNPYSGAVTSDNKFQTLDVKGPGLPFARFTKNQVTKVRLDFAEGGRVEKVHLAQSNQGGRWSQTMEFEWKGDACEVKRVVVSSPDLRNKEGVSYDRELCKSFESKGLLDEKKIDECIDYNDKLGNEIEKATKDYGDSKVFALFTSDAGGKVTFREWKKKDHLSVNTAIARDCMFNLKNSGKQGPGNGATPSVDPAHNGTSAR